MQGARRLRHRPSAAQADRPVRTSFFVRALFTLGLIESGLALGNRGIGRLHRRGWASYVEAQEDLPLFGAVACLDQHVDDPPRRFGAQVSTVDSRGSRQLPKRWVSRPLARSSRREPVAEEPRSQPVQSPCNRSPQPPRPKRAGQDREARPGRSEASPNNPVCGSLLGQEEKHPSASSPQHGVGVAQARLLGPLLGGDAQNQACPFVPATDDERVPGKTGLLNCPRSVASLSGSPLHASATTARPAYP